MTSLFRICTLATFLFGAAATSSCGGPTSDPAPDQVEPSPRPDMSKAYFDRSVAAVCRERYPDDMMMRAACGRNSAEGLADFKAATERFARNAEMQTALAMCFARYTVNGATDFMMAGACSRNQVAGLEEIEAR